MSDEEAASSPAKRLKLSGDSPAAKAPKLGTPKVTELDDSEDEFANAKKGPVKKKRKVNVGEATIAFLREAAEQIDKFCFVLICCDCDCCDSRVSK